MTAQKDTTMSEASDEKDDKKKQDSGKKSKRKGEAEKPELSDEDLELKANLEMMVERISDASPDIQSTALENISRYIYTQAIVMQRP